MTEHIYTSSKGEIFLSWDRWATATLTEAELAIYTNEMVTPDKLALYNRWVEEEKITSHVVMENGEEIQRTDFD
jgi:hypothetical protein